MRSISLRLILGTAFATAIILAVSGVAIHTLLRASLLKEFDNSLLANARGLASMVEQKGPQIRMEYDASQMPEFQQPHRPEYFELWAGDGEVIAKSPTLGDRELERFDPAQGGPARFVTLPNGQHGRVLAIKFQPRPEDEEHPANKIPPATMAVGRETQSLDRTLARIDGLLAAVCGAATLASAALMIWIIRSGLKPLNALAAGIAGVGDRNLAGRITLTNAPRELAPVVERLNELLARLEAAFVREKSFSADVAHELRTPLAGLRTSLEVCSSRPRSREEYEQTIARCLRTTEQLHALVDTLLMLAKVESHQLKMVWENVSVDELLQECWSPFAGRAAERALAVTWEVDPQSGLRTDREKLRLVIRNLFDNAVDCVDERGSIRIHTNRSDGHFLLKILNSGSRLSPEESAHVFERFWRGDVARSQTGMHCGLGLTLCKRITEALGGSITVESEKGGDFRATIALPSPADSVLQSDPARSFSRSFHVTQGSKSP